MGKENSSTAANGGENRYKRKPFYKRSGNGGGDNTNVVTARKTRELKFYLHDSDARKSLESFGKIKESIVLKIQKTFDNPIDLSDSIINKVKKIYSKPKKGKSTLADADEKALENEMFLEEWRIDFAIFRKDENKFNETWTKSYSLI